MSWSLRTATAGDHEFLVGMLGEAAGGVLSLSVDRANPAARLYREEGYVVVARGTTSDTMLKELGRGHAASPRR